MKPLPLILLLCCLVGCVSKQKPKLRLKPTGVIAASDSAYPLIFRSGSFIPDTVNWSHSFYYQDSNMRYGRTVAGKRNENSQWEIFDTVLALKVALSSVDSYWKDQQRSPVYILDNDTITLYPGDTIRATRCREIQSDFKTVSADTISDPKYYANKTNNLK